MDWIKLHADYPNAYTHLEATFKCIYTAKTHEFEVEQRNDVTQTKGTYKPDHIKVTHPLKRDLYDFFDKEGIYISIVVGSTATEQNDFFITISHEGEFNKLTNQNKQLRKYERLPDMIKKRSVAEEYAFNMAFEILNDRLKH